MKNWLACLLLVALSSIVRLRPAFLSQMFLCLECFVASRLWNDCKRLGLDVCGYTATATKSIQMTQQKLLSV